MTSAARDPLVLVLMGASGCGKSTVATVLPGKLGWTFEEGDLLHAQPNIDKMAASHPLNDDDRASWLEKVAEWIQEILDNGQNGLITCSALKRAYLDVINRRGSGVLFVYLNGGPQTTATRLSARRGHFMPPDLLESQFAALEEPAQDESAIRVDIGSSPTEIARDIKETLDLHHRADGE